MGLFTGLITLPLAPVRGVTWIAEQLTEQAEAELYDEQKILRELSELESAHEAGAVTDDQLEEGTDALLARLTEARHHHEQRGLYG